MHVCMYAFMHVCMYVCMYLSIHPSIIYLSIHLSIHPSMIPAGSLSVVSFGRSLGSRARAFFSAAFSDSVTASFPADFFAIFTFSRSVCFASSTTCVPAKKRPRNGRIASAE
jgi:hypothetical protein